MARASFLWIHQSTPPLALNSQVAAQQNPGVPFPALGYLLRAVLQKDCQGLSTTLGCMKDLAQGDALAATKAWIWFLSGIINLITQAIRESETAV